MLYEVKLHFKACNFAKKPTTPFKTKPNIMNWVVTGFGTLICHVGKVKIHNNMRFGLAVLQHHKTTTKSKETFFGKSFINILLIYHEWRSLCLILSHAANRKIFMMPIVSDQLRPLALSVCWGIWYSDLTSWVIFQKKITQNKLRTDLFLKNTCYVILDDLDSLMLKKLEVVPSISILKSYELFAPWAGITTLKSDILLQYFLLAWVWRFLK